MLGWLWRVIVGRFGCEHRWETEGSCRLTTSFGSTGERFYLRCERCGDVTKRDLV